jgi:hypothetical protein
MENMPETLQLLETFDASQTTLGRLLGGPGEVNLAEARQRRTERQAHNQVRLAEAARLLADAFEGDRRANFFLREAMGTDDFDNLFGQVIDRALLGRYRETPAVYREFCRIATVNDFRTVHRYYLDGSEARLATVLENAEYPQSNLSDGVYSYQVAKYGRRVPFSWEAIINDDLQAFRDVPDRLARAARRTESFFATGLYVDSSGPHASLYTSGNANIINTTNGAAATNPALSVAGLQDGMTVLSKQTDTDGEPIAIGAVHLVVPPALEVAALNMLNAVQLEVQTTDSNEGETGGRDSQKLITANWMRNRLRLHVEAYIPIIATSNGDTSWFLFADPAEGRPALEIGFLRGHEAPELWMKRADAVRVSGGEVGEMEGSFDTDNVIYRLRHVVGGSRMDGKMTVGSNGSGS